MAFGRSDRIEPKFAPLGVLKSTKNLRVRKDGRLACRTGYQPVDVDDSRGNDMVAYDLHEFSDGRLCALGASQGEGYPTDVYELRADYAAAPWRPSDDSGAYRPTLTPFTYPRQVCGAPQPAGGMNAVDCAAGGGYVCVAYRPTGGTICHVQIVRESDNQVIFARALTAENWEEVRVCFSVDRFYFLGVDDTSGAIELGSFTPGSSSAITVLATVEASGFTRQNCTLDIEAVTHPTNSHVVLTYVNNSATAQTASLKRYNSAGTQQGSTETQSLDRSFQLAVEADEADDRVNWLTSEYDGSGSNPSVALTTYNFAGSLLDGPTACTGGFRATLCRLPARTGFNEHVAVCSSGISSGATEPLTIEYFDQDSHALTATVAIGNAVLAGGIVAASAEGQPFGVAVGGYVSAEFDVDTNALFYISTTMVHMVTRDLRNSARNAEDFYSPLGFSFDSSTGRVAWCSLYFTGSNIENYTITTFQVNGNERRQSASAGGLLYIAGGPVQVYDGHSVTEAAFNEVPGIKDIVFADITSGNLADNATYHYVVVWEYALPDGTFYESPASPPFEFVTDGAADGVTVTTFGPHSARVALGDAVYGAQVTGVLYRTTWDAVNLSEGSQFHEVKRFTCPSTLSDYGDDIEVTDGLSDSAAATRPILYTQGGPVEHNAPEASSYISASSARITLAGQPRTAEFQESKEQELDEAVNFSGLSAFIGRAPQPLVGVLSVDGIRVLYTVTDIYTVSGDGPENDASGALPAPVKLDSPGGLHDWRSLLNAPDGVWFQLDPTKLYRMPRGQGAPEWLGIDVQDLLADFPVISGACRVRADDAVAFACSNAGGTDARILVRSLRTGLWTEDSPPLATGAGIEALCSFGRLCAYVSGGVVYQQHPTSFADNVSTPITLQWDTHPVYPFEVGGNGVIHDLQATCEFRSSGTLALEVSYDDGATYEEYDSFVINGLTLGATVKKRWSIERSDLQSIAWRLTFTPDAAGEGLIVNQVTLLVDGANGLEDLDPADMA